MERVTKRDETFNERRNQEKAVVRKASKNGDNMYIKKLSKDDEKYADLGIRKASEEFGVGVEYLLWKKWTLKSQVKYAVIQVKNEKQIVLMLDLCKNKTCLEIVCKLNSKEKNLQLMFNKFWKLLFWTMFVCLSSILWNIAWQF